MLLSDFWLTPTQQFFSYIMARTIFVSMRWWRGLLCTRPTRLVGFFIEVAHWNNSTWVDLLPHLDTFSWFQANQSWLFLLNAVCLGEKQQIQILKSLVWIDQGLNPRSTREEHASHFTTDAVVKICDSSYGNKKACSSEEFQFKMKVELDV